VKQQQEEVTEPARRPMRWVPLVAFVATLAVQFALVLTGPANVGLAIVLVAVGMALVFAGLDSPIFAVTMLLFSAFLRLALPKAGLPSEPFVFAYLGVLLATALAVTRRVNQIPKLGAVEVVMGLYLAWNIGSALAPHSLPATLPSTGEDVAVWRFILTGTLMPFTLYLVGRFVFDRESVVRRLLWIILGLAGYSAAVSLLQFYGPAALVWPRYIVTAPEWPGRAVGVFNQPVVNGLVLVIGFAVGLYLAAQPGEPMWRKVLSGGVAVASVPGIYLTHTRAVWLVFALVLVAGAVWARNFRVGFVVTLAAAVATVALDWSTFTSSDRAAGGVASTNEVDDRLNIAATSIWAIEQKPIAGWGIGRFIQLNTYHHKQWSPEIKWERGYGIASHHNELGITAELGVIGLVLWLAVVVLVGHRLFVALRTLPVAGLCGRGLALIAAMGFVSWLVTGQTVDLRYFEFLNALVMLLVGIAVGAAERSRGAPGTTGAPLGARPAVLART
jgi:O-antigen ligase